MPRQPRLDIPNVLHHVIARGIEKRDIFADDDDKERFLARLSSLLTKSATKCFAWALLSNHFHLLLMPTTVSLAETMRRLLTGHAVYFNNKYHRSGHLFQNRYKSILCEEEPYFLELVRYIHLNPLRAGIVSDLEALEHYPWSGHAVLLGHGVMEGQETGEVLARFGKKRAQAMDRYRRFVADGVAAGNRDDLVGGGLRRSLLGADEITSFDERVLGSGRFVESLTGRDKSLEKKPLALTPDDLLKRVCTVTGVNEEDILRPGKERHIARTRAIFCCLAVDVLNYSAKTAGMSAGLGPVGSSLAVRRGREWLRNNPGFREKVLGLG